MGAQVSVVMGAVRRFAHGVYRVCRRVFRPAGGQDEYMIYLRVQTHIASLQTRRDTMVDQIEEMKRPIYEIVTRIRQLREKNMPVPEILVRRLKTLTTEIAAKQQLLKSTELTLTACGHQHTRLTHAISARENSDALHEIASLVDSAVDPDVFEMHTESLVRASHANPRVEDQVDRIGAAADVSDENSLAYSDPTTNPLRGDFLDQMLSAWAPPSTFSTSTSHAVSGMGSDVVSRAVIETHDMPPVPSHLPYASPNVHPPPGVSESDRLLGATPIVQSDGHALDW